MINLIYNAISLAHADKWSSFVLSSYEPQVFPLILKQPPYASEITLLKQKGKT